MRACPSRRLALAFILALGCVPAAAQLTPEQLKAMRERANAPAPAIDVKEFEGRYETSAPERIGTPGAMTKVVLPGDAMPDGPFACKLDRDIDRKRAVLIVPPGGDGIMTLYLAK